jgi:hypothetical protein
MKGYRRVLRWAAFPITNRKWAAPLSAVAVGFGLFVGVAIGPGAAGTLATGAMQIVEVPGTGGTTNQPAEGTDSEGSSVTATTAKPEPGSSSFGSSSGEAASSFAPFTSSAPESEGPIQVPEDAEPEGETPPPAESPETEEEETVKGVVVHLNKAAGSYVLAEHGGEVTAVHAPTAPQRGTEVEVPVQPLANGTYGEAGKRLRLGQETRATLSGIVTYVDPNPSAPLYTLSKRGASMLVHIRPDPSGIAPPLPQLGAFATVKVEIGKPEPPVEPPAPVPAPASTPSSCAPAADQALPIPTVPVTVLWQRRLETEGAPFTYGDFAGVVTAVCPESGQLLLSADDARESRGNLLFTLPIDEGETDQVDLTRLSVGSSVLATATIGATGELSLTGLADDEHRKKADESDGLQGDLAG